jgi:hypothetical protein
VRPFIRFAFAAGIVLAAHTSLAQEVAQPAVEEPAAQPAVEPTTQPSAAPAAQPTTQPLTIPAPAAQNAQASSPVQTPARGLTMAQVKDKLGSPTQEVAAIGTPPISRWEYPGYVVFFESDRVLHTVVTP